MENLSTRQVFRATLWRSRWVSYQVPFDSKGHAPRAARRKLARAYAAGDWRRLDRSGNGSR